MKGAAALPRLFVFLGLAPLSLFALSSCGQARQTLSAREREAIRNLKPTRWERVRDSDVVVMDMRTGSMPIVRQGEVVANFRRLAAAAFFDGYPTVVAKDVHSVIARREPRSAVEEMSAAWGAERRLRILATSDIAFDGRP